MPPAMPNAEIHLHDTYVRVDVLPLPLIVGVIVVACLVVVAILLWRRARRRRDDRD